VVFGDPASGVPSAAEWGAAAGTINYDIVTRVGARVPRRYLPLDTGQAGSDPAGIDPASVEPGDTATGKP